MDKSLEYIRDLIDFIYNNPSPFHITEAIKEKLNQHGFTELNHKEAWQIATGGKYYVTYNNSALFAIELGNENIEKEGFRVIASHTDSPSLKIKPDPEILVNKRYLKLNTEVYGGPILNTWFDRPLSLAGRVMLKSDKALHPEVKLVNFKKALCSIPNLAIHMNRQVNEGVNINRQKELQPIMEIVNEEFEKEDYLLGLLAKELNTDKNNILDFELALYESHKGDITGSKDQFISSPRIDNVGMVHSSLEAFVESGNGANKVLACFDNEEVGSLSKQGAGAPILKNFLERIVSALGKSREDYFRSVHQSFLISADQAHGFHPNYPEKADPVNQPVVNMGPVLKINNNLKYTTDGDSGAVFIDLCQRANVPLQKFVNHSEVAGGGTLGSISTGQVEMRSVDVGNPVLGMHSIREFGGVKDHEWMIKVFRHFYETV